MEMQDGGDWGGLMTQTHEEKRERLETFTES